MAIAEPHADEASFHRFQAEDLPGRIAAGKGAPAFADVVLDEDGQVEHLGQRLGG